MKAETLISGEPTVAAIRDVSAETLADASETFEEMPSTFCSCRFVVETVVDEILYGRLKQYIIKEV